MKSMKFVQNEESIEFVETTGGGDKDVINLPDKITPPPFNDFQKACFNRAKDAAALIIVARPGKGKTWATIGLFLLQRQRWGFKRMLVIAKAVVFQAFHKNNFTNLPITEVAARSQLSSFVPGKIYKDGIWLISDYFLTQIVSKGTRAQKQAWAEFLQGVNLITVDEIHEYRSYQNHSSQALKKTLNYYFCLMKNQPTHHRLVHLTATPIYSDVENIHTLMGYVTPNLFGSYTDFQREYLEIESSYGLVNKIGRISGGGTFHYKDRIQFPKVVGHKNLELLQKKIKPYLFIWKDNDFNFKINLHYYKMTPQEKLDYKQIIKGDKTDFNFLLKLSDIETGTIQSFTKDKNDEVVMDKVGPKLDHSVPEGAVIFHPVANPDNPSVPLTKKFKIVEKKKMKADANLLLRVLQANQRVAFMEDKLQKIKDLIPKLEAGVFIYCHYLDSVDYLKKKMMEMFPTRRVVTVTGSTQIAKTLKTLRKNDILISSSVLSVSVDLYFPDLFFFEPPTVPGAINQISGRLSRENSPYRNINIHFFMRDSGGIELYFYEVHRSRAKRATVANAGQLDFPRSKAVQNLNDARLTPEFLAKNFLWNV